MSKNKSGYVYVAAVKSNKNLCKIGYTKQDPEKRVSNLKRDYPGLEFELYRSFHVDRPMRNEQMAHSILSRKRVDREIFGVTPIEGCIAVQRTIGKMFYHINADYYDFGSGVVKTHKSGAEYTEITSNHSIANYYTYIKTNLGLHFKPEPTFEQFQCIINTYLELYNVNSAYDIDQGKFISLCEEAGL